MAKKRAFLIKNFKKIAWYFEEEKILKIIKSNYQIQNIILEDFDYIYEKSICRYRLINKTSPVVFNSLKGNTIKKTIHY